MAVDYSLLFATPCLSKSFIEESIKEMGVGYSSFNEIQGGFSFKDFDKTLGFSVTYQRDFNRPFGYEDESLDTPFTYVDSVFMPINRLLDWPDDIENVIKFCAIILQRIPDDVLLTINYDAIYLLRERGAYQINSEGGIWQTPTGKAFLAQTPHKLLE